MDALITLWEYDDQFQCLHKIKRTLPAAAFGFFHDVAVTENYYVLLENPTRLDFWKLLSEYTVGKACIAECLTFDQSLGVKVGGQRRPVCVVVIRIAVVFTLVFWKGQTANSNSFSDLM